MQSVITQWPYLIRAFNHWMLDNSLTPYILVHADYDGVEVPRDFVSDGKIVLNISLTAVRNLELGCEFVLFDARFSGRSYHVVVPIRAVIAVFARESGEGITFLGEKYEFITGEKNIQEGDLEPVVTSGAESGAGEPGSDFLPLNRPPHHRSPHLKLVK